VSAVKQKNLDIYGHKPLPWSRALEQLDAGAPGTFWLATTRPDGRPHVAAVGALWIDGRIYFVTGARTRKGRNLAQNANCAISISLKGADAPASCEEVCGPGMAGAGERRRIHRRLQRAERRAAAVGPLRVYA